MYRREFIAAGSLGAGWLGVADRGNRLWEFSFRPFKSQDNVGDWLREQLLLDPQITYLNSASMGCTPKWILESVYQTAREMEVNPFENIWREGLVRGAEATRLKVAEHFGSSAEELMLTENTTSGIASVLSGISWKEGDEILLTSHEHLSCLAVAENFSIRHGLVVRYVDGPSVPSAADDWGGRVEKALNSRTRLCCFSHVDSLAGVRMPVEEIAAVLRRHGVLSLCDGAQAVGMIDVRIRDLGVDAYVACGHKWLLGPKGLGLLHIARDSQKLIRPLENSWSCAVLNPCTGTRDVAHLLAWTSILDLQAELRRGAVTKRIRELAQTAFDEVTRRNNLKPLVVASRDQVETGIVSFCLPTKYESLAVARRLARDFRVEVKALPPTCEVAVDAKAPRRDYNAIRISTHAFNSKQDIDRLCEAMSKVLA